MTEIDHPSVAEALPSALQALKTYLRSDLCKYLWCFADPDRKWLADAFSQASEQLGLKTYQMLLPDRTYSEAELEPIKTLLRTLTSENMVLSIFSDGVARRLPYFRIFPNFSSPQGFAGISGVLRQRYPDKALLKHLLTDPATVRQTIVQVERYSGQKLRITAPGETDLTLEVGPSCVLPYQVSEHKRHAFLPPAEAYLAVLLGSANGTLVVDVTVGELATFERGVIDPLGLVDEPVRVTIVDGYATKIEGGEIARRLQAHLTELGQANRTVVELGFGLSQGEPTGIIGADECLQGTCHFGIGDDSFFGSKNPAKAHLDWVIREPRVEIIPR